MKCLLLVALLGVFVHETCGAGYRLLGIKREAYSRDQTQLRYTNHYLTTESLGPGEEWLLFESHYCFVWKEPLGYCLTYFKITQNPGVEHYQVLGYKAVEWDKDKKGIYDVRYDGETGTTNGAFLQLVTDGEAWVQHGYDSWGYHDIYFYLNKTTEAPLIQAFEWVMIKVGTNVTKPPQIKGNSDDASVWKVVHFRVFTADWGANTVGELRLWITKTTLRNLKADFDRKELIRSNSGQSSETIKERTIVNDHCGNRCDETYVEGQTGQFEESDTITETNRAAFSHTFSFGFSVSYEVGFDLGLVSNTLAMETSMNYQKSEDFEKTASTEKKTSYKWPNVCNPGFKCKTTLYLTSNVYKIPVVFTFERLGETFQVENTLIDSVSSSFENTTVEATGIQC